MAYKFEKKKLGTSMNIRKEEHIITLTDAKWYGLKPCIIDDQY
jgi:hypothetical protein